jgi:hypothetical protein
MNNNSNQIKSIQTLDDLIIVLNQVRDKVGGNAKVMVSNDAQDARYEDECSSFSDVLMFGMQSMMNKHDGEDTRIVLV